MYENKQNEREIIQWRLFFRNVSKAKSKASNQKPEKQQPPKQQQQQQPKPQQQQQQHSVEDPPEFKQVDPQFRRSLISPTNKNSRLKQSSDSSNSSGPEHLDLKSPRNLQGAKLGPINSKQQVDSLQTEVQVTRSDNSILRQDLQATPIYFNSYGAIH